jgi:hypothetical protein
VTSNTVLQADFDTPAWRERRDAHLEVWLKGDQDAIALVQMLGNLSEFWDDLIDRDKELTDVRVHLALTTAVLQLPGNPWWGQAQVCLHPILVVAINAWMDANVLQRREASHDRMLAFFLRDMVHEIVTMMTYLVGGWEHLRKHSLEIREFLFHETFEEWTP